MERHSVAAIVEALNRAAVEYLIVGGLAVVAHGHVRFTADVDLILNLERENVLRGLDALATLGYRPLAPVAGHQFADAAIRSQWIQEKGLTVFTLFSPLHAATAIDLFVDAPFSFEGAHAGALALDVTPGISGAFVSLRDLLFLKRKAGRPKDLDDIERLLAVNPGHERQSSRD